MNDVSYYSRTFPVKGYPLDKKIYDFNLEDIEKVLDALFFLADSLNQKRVFKKPANLLVYKQDSKLILGFNFDKAIYGNTLFGIINPQKNETIDPKKLIQNIAMEDMGLNIDCFVELNYILFSKVFDNLLDQFNANQNNEGLVYVSSTEIKECTREFLKGANNSKSIYGGNGMWVDPIFKAKDITVDPNMCFCVLPFNKVRLTLLKKIIKPHLEKDLGISLIKSGDIFQPNQNIMESIWININHAAFVLVDISDKNPNVFYELGVCHTLGKPVITLCDEKSFKEDYNEKLPFDINALYTIFYKTELDGPQELVNELEKDIKLMRSKGANIK